METLTILAIILIVIKCIFAISFFLYMRKSKKVILELKNRLAESEKKLAESQRNININLDEIRWLKWQINNPPKFKNGDKFGDLIITSRELYKAGLGDSIISACRIIFTALLFHNDKKYIDSLNSEYKKNTCTQWVYELMNTTTFEKVKKRELELSQIEIK